MPGNRFCLGRIVDLGVRRAVLLVVHRLELLVARNLAGKPKVRWLNQMLVTMPCRGFIIPWHFPVDLSVLASLEVPCRELLEFGVAYVVEDTAVNDLCAWSACSKD